MILLAFKLLRKPSKYHYANWHFGVGIFRLYKPPPLNCKHNSVTLLKYNLTITL